MAGHGWNSAGTWTISATTSDRRRQFLQWKTDNVKNQLTGEYGTVPNTHAGPIGRGYRFYRSRRWELWWRILPRTCGLEPRHLGVRAVLVKSFARIHETNLKKQGMLALTFDNKSDYDKIQEDDNIDIIGLTTFSPGKQLTLVLHHSNGNSEEIRVNHSYNEQQIEWFKAGAALNIIRRNLRIKINSLSSGFDKTLRSARGVFSLKGPTAVRLLYMKPYFTCIIPVAIIIDGQFFPAFTNRMVFTKIVASSKSIKYSQLLS